MAIVEIEVQENTNSRISSVDSDYSTARTVGETISSGFRVANSLEAGDYKITRSFFSFDTSSVVGSITRAYIEAYYYRPTTITTDFDVELIKYDYTFPISLSDFNDSLGGTKDVSLINTSQLVNEDDFYLLSSPDLDLSRINQSGITYYAVISSTDISATPPTGLSYCEIYPGFGNILYTKKPTLVIEYTPPSSIQSDILVPEITTAQSTPTAEPSTVTSSDVTNEDNALSNDGTLATMASGGEVTLSSYGISVPAGATITGIQIEPYTATDDGTADLSLFVSKDGTNFTKVDSITSTGSTSAELKSVGGASDSLVLQWTPKELENFYSKVTNNSSGDAYIGFVRVKVFYIFQPQKTPNYVTS